MKNIVLTTLCFLFNVFAYSLHAQSQEGRNKIEMTVEYNGKKSTAIIISFSTTFTRSNYSDEQAATDPSGSTSNAFYLTMEIKRTDEALMKLFSKRQTRFDGTITVTDNFKKNPPRVVKFKQARLENYSEQLSSAAYSYDDMYNGAFSISISSNNLSIDGIELEP